MYAEEIIQAIVQRDQQIIDVTTSLRQTEMVCI